MAMRIVVYGRDGDGAAFSTLGQIRSICASMRVDANVQLVTDTAVQQSSGVHDLPAVAINGTIITAGYLPARTELERTIRMRADH